MGYFNLAPKTAISRKYCKNQLLTEKRASLPTILFFGKISPYKGVETLIEAMGILLKEGININLILTGGIYWEEDYWSHLLKRINKILPEDCIFLNPNYVQDDEMELYFKAADVVVLPYKEIYQSGVHIQSFYYGTPVIATNVGSFREDIKSGEHGYIVFQNNPRALAGTIKLFLEEMYPRLEIVQKNVEEMAKINFSWKQIAIETKEVYLSE